MSIVISDIHGNKRKLETFLKYKPEEEHIILGDFFDSYIASDEDIAESFKLAMESDCVVTYGNHDVHYLSNACYYFACSGNRTNPIFRHLMNTYKDRFVASIIRDDFLLCHGGLSKMHGHNFDNIIDANNWINNEMNSYVNSPVVPASLSSIFDVGYIRGGRQNVSGILWLTFGHEKYDKRFNQICGHTRSNNVRIVKNFKKNEYDSLHVCVDSPMYHCFNTQTKKVEDFMIEEYKSNEELRKTIEVKF